MDLSLRNPNIKALFSCDTLVITLPPNGHHGLKKYASIVTEQSYCEPINDSGDAVLAAEEAFLAAVKIPVAIVR